METTERGVPLTGGVADVRGFYAHLGVEVKRGANGWAQCRCFLPAHTDRHPSMSVNLEGGVWHCHTCTTSGSPYDAAGCSKQGDSRNLTQPLTQPLNARQHRVCGTSAQPFTQK